MLFSLASDGRKDTSKGGLLYERYRFLLYKRAYMIVQDHHLAEDAVHQTFVRIMKSLDKIDETDDARTRAFLTVVCENVAKDIYNERTYLNMTNEENTYICDEIADNDSNPESILINRETTARLQNAIKALDEKYRDVILLKYAHELTTSEICKALNISSDTARARMSRGRKMLVEILVREDAK